MFIAACTRISSAPETLGNLACSKVIDVNIDCDRVLAMQRSCLDHFDHRLAALIDVIRTLRTVDDVSSLALLCTAPIATMASNTSAQMPPPLLHTRSVINVNSGNNSDNAFISPTQTPQGSPSKNRLPPGAYDLPDVFTNAMKLLPTGGSNKAAPKLATSPSKSNIFNKQDYAPQPFDGNESTIYADGKFALPGSPTRKSNKENTEPPRQTLTKEPSFLGSAAASRQDPYRPQDSQRPASPVRPQQKYNNSPTPQELEKLQKPTVKRLANVTQLCEYSIDVA